MQNIYFIIPCAGNGSRIGSDIPKQYILFNQKPIIYCTLLELAKLNIPILLAVSINDNYISSFIHLLPNNIQIAYIGGETRAHTVQNSLNYLYNEIGLNKDDWVLVHDAARPLVSYLDIQNLINKCINEDIGGILAAPIADTIKKIDNDYNVNSTIDRKNIFAAQTPQMFKLGILRKALEYDINVSDESMAIENIGLFPKIIQGSKNNIKITYQEDLEIFEILIKKRLGI